jgi:hypothetical protein
MNRRLASLRHTAHGATQGPEPHLDNLVTAS